MTKSDAEIIELFHEQVNMSADELEEWLAGPESEKAGTGVGHESGEHIVKILRGNPDKDPEKYSAEELQHMHKVVAYNSRHLKQEDHLKETKTTEELEKTKSTISLKNWGHDPVKVKKQQDGELPANGKGDAKAAGQAAVEETAKEDEASGEVGDAQPVTNAKEEASDTTADAEMKDTGKEGGEEQVAAEDGENADVGQKRKRSLRSADKPASTGKPESQAEPKTKHARTSSKGDGTSKENPVTVEDDSEA